MEELLGVWDKIGLNRVTGFIHSSMVMKVFAAKPSPDGENKEYETRVTTDEENPYMNLDLNATDDPNEDATVTKGDPDDEYSRADISGPFARCGDVAVAPFLPAKVPNPMMTPKQLEEHKKKEQQKQQEALPWPFLRFRARSGLVALELDGCVLAATLWAHSPQQLLESIQNGCEAEGAKMHSLINPQLVAAAAGLS